MRLHILVEGAADEAFLKVWLPRFIPQHSFKIIPHQGKGRLSENPQAKPNPVRRGLLDQLPAKLRAYEKSLNPKTDRVLVLIDSDEEPCQQLKKRLLRLLKRCAPNLVALVRVAVEEMEAFYLGDRAAVKRSFPRARLGRLTGYTQDSVCGTWELFREVIGAEHEDKPTWGEAMGAVLGVDWPRLGRNQSTSFRHLGAGILWLAGDRRDRSIAGGRGSTSGGTKGPRR